MTTEAVDCRGRPASPERERPLVGIWLVPLTPDHQTFIIQNTKARFASQKVPGQWNNPAETYEHGPDNGSFRYGTIPRAIREEIGRLDYDPAKVKPLGFIELAALRTVHPQRVIAAPYLIPVESTNSITFEPRDPESGDGKWTKIDEIDESLVQIGPYKLPVFRTPQLEIIAMVRNYLRRRILTPYIKSNAPLIPPDLYAYLESQSRSNILAK